MWIDLANSPHVVFFRPIIRELELRGHETLLTARDFAQTLPLLNLFELKSAMIGEHGGRKLLPKATNILNRGRALAKFIKNKNVDLAIGHNSYSQVIGARLAGIKAVTLMDYENQPANHLAFRLASKVVVPQVFPDEALRRFGAGRRKTVKYPGLKEEVYLSDFEPDAGFPDRFGLDRRRVTVVVRPPADMALYHRFDNPLFERILKLLPDNSSRQLVFLPRTEEQAKQLKSSFKDAIFPEAVDGLNLVYHADLLIGAGGTMNREAAILGTPVYSIFAGKIGEVDRSLIRTGAMRHVAGVQDLNNIRFAKKDLATKQFRTEKGKTLVEALIDIMLGETK